MAKETILREVPFNIDAEKALLGCILLNNEIYYEVEGIIVSDYFYYNAHKTIFNSMTDLRREGKAIDLVTISDALEKKGKLEQVGGEEYLAELLEKVPVASNFQFYMDIVKSKGILRRLIEISGRIAEKCYRQEEDINSILDRASSDIFELTYKNAPSSYHVIDNVLASVFQFIDKRVKKKGQTIGLPTFFYDLDKLTYGFQEGNFIIIAAQTSRGKTTLALNMVCNIASQGNAPVAFFSMEMPAELLVIRLLCADAEVSSSAIMTGKLADKEGQELFTRLTGSASKLQNLPVFIDDSPSLEIYELKNKARKIKKERDVQLIVVDYIQLIQTRTKGENRQQQIANISRELKSLARELKIPVIGISQLSRSIDKSERKRKPILSDLRESGALEQDADIVLFLYRREFETDEPVHIPEPGEIMSEEVEILVRKNRNGPTGNFKLFFRPSIYKFDNYTYSHEPV